MRKVLSLAAVTAMTAAGLVGLAGSPASAAGCASWSVSGGTLKVTNVCGPRNSTRKFTPHVHVGSAPVLLTCKSILSAGSATWSITSRTHVDSVADAASC